MIGQPLGPGGRGKSVLRVFHHKIASRTAKVDAKVVDRRKDATANMVVVTWGCDSCL